MSFRKYLTRRAVVGLAATAAIGAALVATLPASAASAGSARPKPVVPGSRYLALGDSVSFGYREASNLPTPEYAKPDTFTGFPEIVARDLGVKLTNAACPGETTGSMITLTRQSNGCWTQPDPQHSPGYRQLFPLHTKYSGSQLDFAVNYLKQHPDTRLVTLMIGANDGFLCQERTADHCKNPNELLKVLSRVGKNVGTILQRLRQGAGYAGQIVIVNYYSLNYARLMQNGQSKALNEVIDNAAQPFDVRIANGFRLFRADALQAGGNTCKAGLLTILQGASTPCGVHPSFAGQTLLASGVERNTIKS